ncbi:MAG TPA: hypothetical protein VHN38_09615 [Immundisolibacter sp.]|nr:hypothetical protein [Immundisolibacter sp.]
MGRVYNDNVNSPQIRKWLGGVAGKEGETLHRRGRWLPMMYPRLVLLKEALNESIPGFHRGRPGFLSARHPKPL